MDVMGVLALRLEEIWQHRVTGYVAAVLVLVVGFGLVQSRRRRISRLRTELQCLELEEARMFDFLHNLGSAIGPDTSVRNLASLIVEGVDQVVRARGGAIYLLSEDGQFLIPEYISEMCPPLAGLPAGLRRDAESFERMRESHQRLAAVGVDEGVLGQCLRMAEVMWVKDMKHHEAFRGENCYLDEVSALVAPLRHGRRDLGVLAVARTLGDGAFTQNDFAVFRSLAEQSGFALGNAHLHRLAQEKRAMESELSTARDVQRVLLPQRGPELRGYRVTGHNVPARIISGDYYDFLPLRDGGCGVAIADVSGKGVGAGLLMAMCRSTLRLVAQMGESPAVTLGAVNRQMFPDIREDMFISMTYLALNGENGRVGMVRAGHEPTLWYHGRTGEVEKVKSPGLALGIDEGSVFERVTKDVEIEMEEGDCLLLFTDGLKEALNREEEEFGNERIAGIFGDCAKMGGELLIEKMLSDLKAYTGDVAQMDDITLVVVEKVVGDEG